MLLTNQRFRTLRDLVQTELTELASIEVPGIVVVVPSKKKIDVYASHGSGVDTTLDSLRTLRWVVADHDGDAWVRRSLSESEREQLLDSLEGAA